jgi:DNA processing protein
MSQDLIYHIALTQIEGIGSVQAKLLLEKLGSASSIFKASKQQLAAVEGIGEVRARQIKNYNQFNAAEAELNFASKNNITILTQHCKDYPQRLLHCYDAPTILYFKGNTSLNNSKIVSIIGTRTYTDYGKQVTEELVNALEPLNVLIVSGLAFGIDAIAHKTALKNKLHTIGVVAHGLHTIYPYQHKSLANEMEKNGGLLTELGNTEKPDKHNFPKRNRIVAGMADATIVIETAVKGGSMITAQLAYNYNRDVFAVPGKLYDAKSSGCLKLIQQQKAIVYTGIQDMLLELGWQSATEVKPKKQRELFTQLTVQETQIMQLLEAGNGAVHIDEIYLKSGLSSSSVAAAILNLEMMAFITALPGKMYQVI